MKHLLIVALCATSGLVWSQQLSLPEALKTARQNRPAIRAAILEVDQVRRASAALGAYPATEFGLGVSSKSDLGATDQDLFIVQPLDLFARTSANRQLGKANLGEAKAGLRASLLAVQAEVLRSYFEASTATRVSLVSRDLAQLSETLYLAAKRRFEEGKAPEVQVTRAQIERDRAQQTAALREAQRAAAIKRLSGALGVSADSLGVDADALLEVATTQDTSLRPDLLALQAQARIADAEAGIAGKALLPRIELIGLRSPWGEDSGRFAARLQLTMPLFDHGRARLDTQSARQRASAARERLADAQQRAVRELAAIEIEIAAASERVTSYEAIQLSARGLLQKSQRGYDEGIGTLLDVLEATRALREVEQELSEARLALNLAKASRLVALGFLVEEMR